GRAGRSVRGRQRGRRFPGPDARAGGRHGVRADGGAAVCAAAGFPGEGFGAPGRRLLYPEPTAGVRGHEEAYAGQPSTGRADTGRQPPAGGADLPDGEVRVRVARGDGTVSARRAPRLLLRTLVQPHDATARTTARGTAGAGRLPGHRD